MKILKRILFFFLVFLFISVLVGFILVYRIGHKSLPDYNENVVLSGMNEEVTIYRDEFAIPHIYAKNESDLYRATGYVMAQDRLWQMDLLRRATTGRLSEIFGKDLVRTDLTLRLLRIPEKSEMVWNDSPEDFKNAMICFADGVNQFIDSNLDKLPPEFTILGYKPEKWEPQHSLNLIGYMAWDLNSAWSAEITIAQIQQKVGQELGQLFVPQIETQPTTIYPNFQFSNDSNEIEIIENLDESLSFLEENGLTVFNGSNNWAVSGEKSTTGKPLLANDMHLGLSAPGIWYQIHQVVEGQYNVTGLAVPGQPMIIAGHNDFFAWGMTNVMIDDLDFYVENLNDDKTKYLVDSVWKDLIIKQEEIVTKEGETILENVLYTHRGPIVSEQHDEKEQFISMRWSGNDFSNEALSVYKLNKGKNYEDFKTAMHTFLSVSQNVVYADVDGNIALHCCAGIPIRPVGNGLQLYDGTTSKSDWLGYVPFDSLPFTLNPESGMLSSANNKTVDESYPFHISHWFDMPYRIDRIRELLAAKEKLGVDDFVAIQNDFHAEWAKKFLSEIIVEVKKNENLSETESTVVALIENWDGNLSTESIETTVFEHFYDLFYKNVAEDNIGELLFAKMLKSKIVIRNFVRNVLNNKTSEWYDITTTADKKETYTDIVQITFSQTVDLLSERMGDDPNLWQWGNIHKFTLMHPLGKVKLLDLVFYLNRGDFPVAGSFHTVSPYAGKIDNKAIITHGASHRHIYNLANWDESLTVIPTGTSGIPASKHYCDQTEMYVSGEYHQDFTSREVVETKAVYVMKIIP